MSTDFPTSIDTFPTAAELVDDTLATNPHSTLHGNLGDAITAIEGLLVGPTVFNVKSYGALGDGTTDDTSAFNNAIVAAQAVSAGRGTVYVPPGNYLVGALTTISFTGLSIVGAGSLASKITASATTLFVLGTFSASPSTYYDGTAAWFRVAHLWLDGDQSGTTEGSRTRIAITDNGCGNVTLDDVVIEGWQYGLKANYGSDHDRIDNATFQNCDVGVYLGTGSDKALLTAVQFYYCREGFVGDALFHTHITACYFTDCLLSGIQIEWLTSPRGGLATNASASLNGQLVIDGCWFESITRNPTNGHIHLYNQSDTSYPRGVHIRDCLCIAGGSGTNQPFVYAETGEHIVLSDNVIFGTEVSYVVSRGTNAHFINQERTRLTDGTTAVLWGSRDATCVTRGAGGLLYTITGNDTSPSAAIWETAYSYNPDFYAITNTASTTITVFDDGWVGQRITVYSTNGNTSFANGSGITTRTGGTVTLGTNSCTAFVFDGGSWYQEA